MQYDLNLTIIFVYLSIYFACLCACLFVCLFVSNKRQNGWTDRAQIFCGTSRDHREGLWMIKISNTCLHQNAIVIKLNKRMKSGMSDSQPYPLNLNLRNNKKDIVGFLSTKLVNSYRFPNCFNRKNPQVTFLGNNQFNLQRQRAPLWISHAIKWSFTWNKY